MMRISLVTPSYNQAEFIAATLDSIHAQAYPALEHIVIDGGSTDGSQAIIQAQADRLSYWVSESDNGQYDALNKGFAQSTGEIMGWLNSDDLHLPWTLHTVAWIFKALPDVEWITTRYPMQVEADGRTVQTAFTPGFNGRAFMQGAHSGTPWSLNWIMQEGTFWRRTLWERAGSKLDTQYTLAADFELWARFYQHAPLYGVDVALAQFRLQPAQRSFTQQADYIAQAQTALKAHGGQPYTTLTGKIARLRRRLPLIFRQKNKVIRYERTGQTWVKTED
jgi:hypothetical protein